MDSGSALEGKLAKATVNGVAAVVEGVDTATAFVVFDAFLGPWVPSSAVVSEGRLPPAETTVSSLPPAVVRAARAKMTDLG